MSVRHGGGGVGGWVGVGVRTGDARGRGKHRSLDAQGCAGLLDAV